MAGDARGNIEQALNVHGTCIGIFVGDDHTGFSAHEELLRARSGFFAAALKKCWHEGHEKRVELPEDKPTTVTTYLQHLYSSKICLTWTTAARVKDLPASRLLPEYVTLAELYVFGEKMQDVTFKNAVIDAFLSRILETIGDMTYYPITTAVDIIYKGTLAGSQARELMVDLHVTSGGGAWIYGDLEDNNAEFMMDLSRALLDKRAMPVTDATLKATLEKGTYHEKAGGQVKKD